MYKTVVIEYTPGADKMAEKIEETANAMYEHGYGYNVYNWFCKSNFGI